MARTRHTTQTAATLWLDQHKIAYTMHQYEYVDHGGAQHAAAELDADPHCVAKTLIMEDEHAQPLIVIMHGDRNVSTKQLARQTGTKRITPCTPKNAERHTGYKVGGTSPFGTRKTMPVWVETGLLSLDRIYINGGRRGLLLGIQPGTLIDILGGKPVQAGIEPG